VPSSVYIAGGVTLALAAGAGVSGVVYLKRKGDYQDLVDRHETSGVQDGHDLALKYGYLNLGLWIGSAIGAGVTTYLYVTRPTTSTSLRVTPLVGPRLAGFGASGSF
jgi:hypothetical protein